MVDSEIIIRNKRISKTTMKGKAFQGFRILHLVFISTILFLLSGCAPGSAAKGEIAGSVTDINGNPVRGAGVYIGSQLLGETSPNGTFVIRDVGEGVIEVRVELTRDGATFRGRNKVVVFRNERTTSIAIVVARTNQLGSVRGIVKDEFNTPLEGVRVFAGGPLGSWMDVTDSDGEYLIRDLVGGYDYTMTASGRGYENDSSTFSCVAGSTLTKNFFLRLSGNEIQPRPQNVQAYAFTSPVVPTRSVEENRAYLAIKHLIKPQLKRPASTRGTALIDHIEVDLVWDYAATQEILGFGIYKGNSSIGLTQYDVLRDPLATFYADISDFLLPGSTYYYAVSRLNTDFPNAVGSESPLSSVVNATPLGDLFLQNVGFGPLRFRWDFVTDVDDYTVYVFDRYPDIEVSPIRVLGPVSGSSVNYSGPPNLVSGNTYWYVVVGSGYGGSSQTISQIDSFVAP